MQLVQQDSESNATVQQGGGERIGRRQQRRRSSDWTAAAIAAVAASGGQQQKRGQEALYKDGQKSPLFVDVTKDKTRLSGKTAPHDAR